MPFAPLVAACSTIHLPPLNGQPGARRRSTCASIGWGWRMCLMLTWRIHGDVLIGPRAFAARRGTKPIEEHSPGDAA